MKLFIKINDLDSIYKFVDAAKEVDGDVIVHKGKFCVDGKSILGVVSLNMASGVMVEYPDNADSFTDFLSRYTY